MPEPGESVEPLAKRLIEATFCHVAELFATTEDVYPPGLADLVRRLG